MENQIISKINKEDFNISIMYEHISTKYDSEMAELSKILLILESEVPVYIKEFNSKLNENCDNSYLLDMKQMYRKISAKCHPDKTNDKELHKLFVLANDAFHENKKPVLYSILNKININEKFTNLKEDYDHFCNTIGYKILKEYKAGKINEARKLFIDIIFSKII